MKCAIKVTRILILLCFVFIAGEGLFAQDIQEKQLLFIENKGQIIDQLGNPNPAVRYLLSTNGLNVQLRQNGFSYDIYQIDKTSSTEEHKAQKGVAYDQRFPVDTSSSLINFHRIDINFEGANPDCEIIAEDPSSDYLNYYTTGTPESGITHVQHFSKVIYRNLYHGIDLECLTTGSQPFKYNFIVHPGANIDDIKLKIDGASEIIEEDGHLVFVNSINTIKEKIPVSFLLQENRRTDIQISFRKVEGNIYGFTASREVPSDASLIIDPLPDLVWGTYYGGSNLDYLFDCAFDLDGNIYGAGYTYSVNNIASTGAFQSIKSGNYDAILIKFNSAGSRLWGTYYGGTDYDGADGVTVDGAGNCYLVGTSFSDGIATSGAHQSTRAGMSDALLARFTSAGAREWATYYGGTQTDNAVSIVIDTSGTCFIAGSTDSPTGIATPGTHQTVYAGLTDAFVATCDTSGVFQWGTYYGGSYQDNGMDISVNEYGYIYVTGRTNSLNGIATPGAHKTSTNGNGDAFLVKLYSSGLRQWGTYYGGDWWESGNGVSAGESGHVYITGQAESINGITTPGAFQPAYTGGASVFLSKFDSSGIIQWGTYFGNLWGVGFSVTTNGNGKIYLIGSTVSQDVISTPGSYQPALAGNVDAFLAEFNSSGSRVWGTYYGGPDADDAIGISSDGNGHILLSGYTQSLTGIAIPGAHQTTYGGGLYDGFVAKFTTCSPTNITSQPSNLAQCIGTAADFLVVATGDALSYQWQGDTGSGFTNLSNTGHYSGALSNHLMIDTTSIPMNGYLFRCVITNSCLDIVNSTSALLTVNPLPTPTITSPPLLTESFENGGALPPTWSLETIVPNNTVDFVNSSSFPPGFTAYQGTWMVRFDSYLAGNGVVRLKKTTPVSTIGYSNVDVSFAWLESSSFPVSNDRVDIEWSLDGTTWSSAGSFTRYNPVAGWKIKSQILPAGASGQATLYIAFKFTSQFGNDCYLDLAQVTVGNTTVCAGNTISYQTEPGMTTYFWTVSSGGTITSGLGTSMINVLWNTPGSDTVSVNYTDTNGCKGALPSTVMVTVNSLPVPTITGADTLCKNTTAIYHTEQNMAAYAWAVSSGGTINGTSNDSIVSVTWDSVGSGGSRWVKVIHAGFTGCLASMPTQYDVTVHPLPVPSVNGIQNVCLHSTEIYSTQKNMTGYLWTVSSGGTINGTANDSIVSVTWDSVGSGSTRWVAVNYMDANGCYASSPTQVSVVVMPLPIPAISGPQQVCVTDIVTYSTQFGVTGYTWNVSSGGTINGSASDSVLNVTWNTIGSGTSRWVKVNYIGVNGCTADIATPLIVTVNPVPVPTISGSQIVCNHDTLIYQTESGMTGYLWSISSGGTIIGLATDSLVSVTWDSTGTQQLIVNYTNSFGCVGLVPDTLAVTVNSLPVPSLSGPIAICFQSAGNVYQTDAGMSNYSWTIVNGTVTAGGTLTDNTATITWNLASGSAHSVAISYTDLLGCQPATDSILPVTVYPLPSPMITGPDSICFTSDTIVYSTENGMTIYTWTISSGGTITSGAGTDSISVVWDSLGLQWAGITYIDTNGCMADTPTVYPVTILPVPSPTISGPDSLCVGTASNGYITESGMNNYSWLVSSGGTITSGAGTDSLTVTWDSTGTQQVSVVYANTEGCIGDTAFFPVTILPLPQPIITGPDTCCSGIAGNSYSTQSGMIGYIWTVSSGGTITAGIGTNSISVTWNSTGSESVGVSYMDTNSCSGSSPPFAVMVLSGQAPTITGSTVACITDTYIYSTESGMNNYQWIVSLGGMIVSGSGTSQVEINWIGSGAQWVTVNYSNSSGCSATIPTQLDVSVTPLPGTPGAITGPAIVCSGDSAIPYSITPIPNANSYNWVLPPGATIATGLGTNSITVDFSITAITGNMEASGSNECGIGPPSPTLNILVSKPPAETGAVSGLDTVCKGATGVNYFISPIPAADSYVWSVPAGSSIVSGGNTESIFVDFADTASSGLISVYSTNYCGSGTISPEFSVTMVDAPSAPIITQAFDYLHSDQPIGNQWYFDGTLIPGATGQSYLVLEDGEYWDVVNRFGCTTDTSNHIVVVVTGIDEMRNSGFSVHPVPNDGRFTLTMRIPGEDVFTIRIYNNLGLSVYELRDVEVNKRTVQNIDLRPAPNGVYTVVVENDTIRLLRKIIVIK